MTIRVRQEEFFNNFQHEHLDVYTLLTRKEKYIFCKQTEVDVVTFTKRSLFRKGNLPCISSPATETFATFSLVFARRKPRLACVCVHVVNVYDLQGKACIHLTVCGTSYLLLLSARQVVMK